MIRLWLNPLNWPAAALVLAARLLILLPHSVVLGVGGLLGSASRLLVKDRLLVADTNLAACFPELDPARRQDLLRENLRNTGRGLLETVMGLWSSDRRLRGLTDVEGLEHLRHAEQVGGLVIICHVTMVELMARLVSLHSETGLFLLARRNNQPLLEAMMGAARRRHHRQVMEKKDTLGLLRTLKSGGLVGYAPDQDFNYGSTFADFFGIPAATVTATSQLPARGGGTVLPAWCHRDSGGRYQLRFFPPFADFPSEDPAADAARVNAWIEQQVRQHPAQYLWVHRRFKTRPPGEPAFYQPRARRPKHR